MLLVENDWSDGYLPPGSGVEPGEDPETATVREVHGETGVAVEIERPIRTQKGWIERESDGERFGLGSSQPEVSLRASSSQSGSSTVVSPTPTYSTTTVRRTTSPSVSMV